MSQGYPHFGLPITVILVVRNVFSCVVFFLPLTHKKEHMYMKYLAKYLAKNAVLPKAYDNEIRFCATLQKSGL